MDRKCKCGCTSFFTEVHGNNTGLYCTNCGKWQKWLTKNEVRLFNHEKSSAADRIMERINQSAIKVSTVANPHIYMKAVGTKELERILREELHG